MSHLKVLLWLVCSTVCSDITFVRELIPVPSIITLSANSCYIFTITIPQQVYDLAISLYTCATDQELTILMKKVRFTRGDRAGSVILCSHTNTSGTYTVGMTLEGDESQYYRLSNQGEMKVTVQKAKSEIVISEAGVTSTTIELKVGTVNPSTIFYAVWNSRLKKTYDFMFVKQLAQSSTGTLPQKGITAQFSQIWAGQAATHNATPITISVDQLTPATGYTACLYTENKLGKYSPPICKSLVTSDSYFLSAFFNFSRRIQPWELNRLLCYLVYKVQSDLVSITALTGQSCNPFGRQPINYMYSYQHETVLTANSTFISLLWPGKSVWSNFQNLFDSITFQMKAEVVAQAADFGITFLADTKFTTSIMVSRLLLKQMPVRLGIDIKSIEQFPGRLVLNSVKNSRLGTVYFALITAKAAPTAQEVANCRVGEKEEAICKRLVFSDIVTVNVSFSGMKEELEYRLYSVTANEFPHEVILDKEVLEVSRTVAVRPSKTSCREVFTLSLLLLVFVISH